VARIERDAVLIAAADDKAFLAARNRPAAPFFAMALVVMGRTK
jgi:hypothetical protein